MKRFISLPSLLFLLLLVASFSPYISPPLALVLGFMLTHFLGNPFAQYNKSAVNWTLKIAVVGLGFGIGAQEALAAGSSGLLFAVATITFTMILGVFLGRLLKLNKRSAYLLSSGTAICGGSAIAAIAPVIKAEEKDISMAMGTVFLLNSVALLLFPYLGELMSLTQYQFGLWAAIAIHDTSSVVGAAATYGAEALEVATTVKLVRALWIIPLALITARLFKSEGKPKMPWFILLFVLALLIRSYTPFPEAWGDAISGLSRQLLSATLFLVGAGLSVAQIKKAGWPSLILGLSLWLAISVLSLLVILSL